MSEQIDIKKFSKVAAKFAEKIRLNNLPEKTIVFLYGELGAGKTEFVKSVLLALKIKQVVSPTFALHMHYEVDELNIEHWDLYRLENEDELESTGFWDQFSSEKYLIFVEWPQRLNLEWIPKDTNIIKIFIEIKSPKLRSIRIENIS